MTPQFTATPHSKGWGPIMRALREHGPLTRVQLANVLGRSATYTQGYLPAMVASGAVCVVGASHVNQAGSIFGKQPKLYAVPESAS